MDKPTHYSNMKIDVIDFCNMNGLDFNQGNVIKYVCRYKLKDGLSDLKKARTYIDRMIKAEEERIKNENEENIKKNNSTYILLNYDESHITNKPSCR